MSSEEDIFEAAAALPEADRQAYLDSACAGQPELRARIESLLLSHEAKGFMEGRTAASSVSRAEQSGERIGRYRLLQQIGEGGFGVVWMAEQIEPVTRRVAFKIIKAGMDTKEVIARFEAERQALAMMDHPNIAKVHDAGSTDSGRPYFVMELVKGIPITKFCDEQEFTTRQRLALFADVCSAINHAHQKGVIHRDIKPTNVMVTLHGDRPVPKVIDFGIAKATQGKLTEHTLFTRFEQFVGTPAYMSPEQTALSGLDTDTRSDIYALGILLYELLTGKPPFDTKKLLSAGYEEMSRIIREVEPPKPSSRLSTVAGDERTLLAKARQIAPEKLRRLVQPDLDWIVMKAIEKDRTRRYETADGLALDIGRFLADEPVSAGPPAAGYQFRKFARRHKAALRVAATIAAVLVAATTVSTWQAVRATRAEWRERKKADDERAAREDAEAVANLLNDVFKSAAPARDGPAVTVVQILDHTADQLDANFEDQPSRRARLQVSLSDTYYALGHYQGAISLLEKAKRYYVATLGQQNPATLGALQKLAHSYHAAGRLEEALQLKETVLELRRRMLMAGREAFGPEHPATYGLMHSLATSYSDAGRLDEAIEVRDQLRMLSRKVLGPKHPATLTALYDLALTIQKQGRLAEARELAGQAMEGQRKVLGIKHPDTKKSEKLYEELTTKK